MYKKIALHTKETMRNFQNQLKFFCPLIPEDVLSSVGKKLIPFPTLLYQELLKETSYLKARNDNIANESPTERGKKKRIGSKIKNP